MRLQVLNLSVRLGQNVLLENISFELESGEKLGVIGASGAGKTLLSLALAGVLPERFETNGQILFDGFDLLKLSPTELAKVRGDQIGFVFQEPRVALNPLQKAGRQITEALTNHYSLTKQQRGEAATRLAAKVGLTDLDRVLNSYPHQISGGQLQRVAIAAAIATEPKLLIADEPTTALDVSVQRGILDLINSLSTELNIATIFVTHDIAVLSQVADTVLVLDGGKPVETGTLAHVLTSPKHEVTRELIEAARSAEWGAKND